jgi:hypothetical protein
MHIEYSLYSANVYLEKKDFPGVDTFIYLVPNLSICISRAPCENPFRYLWKEVKNSISSFLLGFPVCVCGGGGGDHPTSFFTPYIFL